MHAELRQMHSVSAIVSMVASVGILKPDVKWDQAAADGVAQDLIDSAPLPFKQLGGKTWRPGKVPSW